MFVAGRFRALGQRSSIRRLIGSGLIGAIIGAVVAALVVGNMLSDSDPVIERVVEREITTANVAAVTQSGAQALEVADIAAEVTPSVVRVEVLRYGQVTGTGSGVIFRDDGHLITNTHVVDSGDSFQIVLADGAVPNVELVGMWIGERCSRAPTLG